MISVKGYNCMGYQEFQKLFHRAKIDSPKTTPEIAVCCKIKDTYTINNCFNTKKQVAKDSVVTQVMKCLGIDGFILWQDGERVYYVKSK